MDFKMMGIFIVAIIIPMTILMINIDSHKEITNLKAELASDVRLSTNQEDWKECRMEVWNGCGLGNKYDEVIQPMNARYSRSDKEILEYIEPLISYCQANVAEYKCDAKFNMKKIKSAKTAIEGVSNR